ncbi:MAG TPA: hypothetical protein VFP84_15380 [Kofleriaceae bacterium]|nr:hypothetical protein [Kofleriaceae bacterium]
MKEILITSALAELTFAVLLGWPLNMFRAGARAAGPLRNAKRLLQAHLDYIFMAFAQMGIATVHPAVPPIAGWLLVVGSWTNPTLFLLGSALPDRQHTALSSVLTTASFAVLTVAYPWLLYAWLTR